MTTLELLERLDLNVEGPVEARYIWQVITKFTHLNMQEVYVQHRRPSRTLRETILRAFGRREDPEAASLDLIEPRKFFLSLDALESKWDTLRLEVSGRPEIAGLVRSFSETYEEGLRSGRLDSDVISRMFHISINFQTECRFLSEVKLLIEKNLIEFDYITQREGRSLSLLLKSDFHLLPPFIEKLDALNFMYEELCQLFQISSKEIPFVIERVESGSLWAKLFGERRVVTLLISLIESAVDYLHRNFTSEGKLTALPKGVETISLMLDLEAKLRKSGIDTIELKENIQKSSILISKQLNKLLAGEAVVEINERRHSVGAELERVYLDQSRRLLIEDKIDDKGALENG